ncbi:DUF6314 family protein [Limosilactobacillus fermentum]|uniref:DUF6314 domain-containing protein n=1 Tax=Limosilactobacillus fermentum TaxID=1613 RepID=A0ABD0AJD1_LIMFE|nr:DUF6314 family protein [Limosilactobacillus fermentum]PHI33015.1 hypothetical protein CEW18_08775 [Limosilactobacillus fermentum]UVW03525.1 DUF6314 family protein [Limosilactobacillus fermentum]WEN05992.1 DUF6314 family protein [Limosilactobacillus fermentum]WEN12847.1 DUF6314 family protein [Limosilactobacillus fermentum]WJD39501.1 DUF6314 family protein [Limosilactobacillus fermentum]
MKLYDYFLGDWQLTGTSRNSTGPAATMHGTLRFSPLSPDSLLLTENGEMIMGKTAAPLSFWREYRYQFAGDRVLVYFHDQPSGNYELYQAYRLDENGQLLVPDNTYLCALDTYDARFELSNGHFTHHTKVYGPKKDYRLDKELQRI